MTVTPIEEAAERCEAKERFAAFLEDCAKQVRESEVLPMTANVQVSWNDGDVTTAYIQNGECTFPLAIGAIEIAKARMIKNALE